MDMDGAAVSIRLRRSIPSHDAYTVRVFDRRFAALATARPADARRWVTTTRWLHGGFLHQGRLVVGLGVQWTPTGRPLHGALPLPATLQLCVGHRCLVFHLAHADAIPEMLRRFLADPRVTFVGSGANNDRRMLWAHYGLHVARWCELRAVAGMGNASLGDMADRFLGYPGIYKPREVAMSQWHAPRLSPDQVQYASVDAYLAFRLAVILCHAAIPARQPVPPALVRQAPPAQQRAPAHVRPAPPPQHQQRAPAVVRPAPPPQHQQRAPAVVRPAPPAQRALAVVRQAPPVQRAPVVVECSPRAFSGVPVPAVGSYSNMSKLMNTHAGLIESDTDSETDYDDVGGTGLPIRVYASDSDIVDSSDGFEHVRLGASSDDDEEDEDDDYVSYSGTGSLGADGVDSNVDDHEDEEGSNGDDQDAEDGYSGDDQEDGQGCNGDDQDAEDGCNGDDQDAEAGCNGDDLEDEEGYQEYIGTGILTGDNMDGYGEFVGNGAATTNLEEEVCGGYQAFEYLGHCEAVVLDNGDDALAHDDWYDQEVDYGCDQDAEVEFDEEFYLL